MICSYFFHFNCDNYILVLITETSAIITVSVRTGLWFTSDASLNTGSQSHYLTYLSNLNINDLLFLPHMFTTLKTPVMYLQSLMLSNRIIE